jgi:regulator of PEP synthase PpsR (kinase-PPPase family)
MNTRQIYMISDGTGITAEHLGNSLLSQFENINFEKKIIPYIDSVQKAHDFINHINKNAHANKPIFFITIVNLEIAQVLTEANAIIFDLFQTFLKPLEQALEQPCSYTVGKTHAVHNEKSYSERIEAINFALGHDDGIKFSDYEAADIILLGVSRSGKTPSCLYMALHFGLLAANYPLADADLNAPYLPKVLKPFRNKLFGLTIDPTRLQQIRHERRPNSSYSSLTQCQFEVKLAENMYKNERIPFLNSTHFSIEEIATRIMTTIGIERRL